MDVLDREARSRVMASVRSSGNRSTELAVIQVFRTNGVSGWRRKWPILGKPDFVWPRLKVALFIDGCFWHGCRYHCRLPATNKHYWIRKIVGNRARDRHICRELRKRGWRAVRVWEHEIKSPDRLVDKIRQSLAVH